MFVPSRRLAVLIAASSLLLAACGAGSKANSAPGGKMSKVGVSVTGTFGQKPTLTVPTSAAPTSLNTEAISEGTGPAVSTGQTLVVNYLGQTWDLKDGKPNIFDNSFDHKQVFSFPLGGGQVIPGWDKGLVGQHVGSRVLLTIPAAQAYGASASASEPLAGHTLVFVVDLIAAFSPNAAASGTPVTPPAGFPKVTSEPGKKPTVDSVEGIKADAQPRSTLLIQGNGAKLDATKSFIMEIVQVELASGKKNETWGGPLQLGSGQAVMTALTALKGGNVGSRVLAVMPAEAQSKTPDSTLIVDVVGQY
ncbi:MAG TPA: FKBP-type peptidyl-prolyl cis-trans isomerase [Kineosporiaceae bacterium]|nr:FKBP-type peptidyl-prolyl cis-trans isomerase [Kineosporiaceae bacterium]